MLSTPIAICLFIFTSIFTLVQGAAIESKFVKFDLEHKVDHELIEKRGLNRAALTDRYSYFLTTVQVGSNKQSVQLLVDSGSSDMFVIDSKACPLCSLGTFTQSQSKSFKNLNQKFSLNYGSGVATGIWGTDTVNVGSVSINNQRLAVASQHPTQFGVFGVGFSPDVIKINPSYPNFAKNLKTSGKISRIAYSFFAGLHGKNNGHLLFGAVDFGKISGGLKKVAMAAGTSPKITLNGINLKSSYAGIKPCSLASPKVDMLVDTGTSFTVIPTQAFNNLTKSLKATKTNGNYYVDCGLMNQNIQLDFNFSNTHINVNLKDLIYQTSATQCMLGVQGSGNMYIFGADALRSVYMVFDLEGRSYYIGQANQNSNTENIKQITNAVPTN